MSDARPVTSNPRPETPPAKKHDNPRSVRTTGTNAGTKPSPAAVDGEQSKAANRAARSLATNEEDSR